MFANTFIKPSSASHWHPGRRCAYQLASGAHPAGGAWKVLAERGIVRGMLHSVSHRGFTLIELIVVMGILAVIAATIAVAVDPARRLHEANNVTRRTDVRAVLEAVKTYQADNGAFPATAVAIDNDDATVQMLGAGGTACGSLTCGSLAFPASSCFVTGLDGDLSRYLKKLPKDPVTGTTTTAQYYINKDANGFVVVGACDPQGESFGGSGTPPVIEVSR